jgi:hypothetical protein
MPNDVVQVSGLVGAGGTITATRIERRAADAGLRVIGAVSSVDSASYTFHVNGLVVDYGGVRMLEGFPNGQPMNGDTVLVEGSALNASGELAAEQIELRSAGIGVTEGQRAEVEGFITRFGSTTDFDVSGAPVTTNSSTAYEGGSGSDLALNVKVEIEGRVDASGVIVARKIEVKDGGRIQGSSDR